jgi:hypothetical protein
VNRTVARHSVTEGEFAQVRIETVVYSNMDIPDRSPRKHGCYVAYAVRVRGNDGKRR